MDSADRLLLPVAETSLRLRKGACRNGKAILKQGPTERAFGDGPQELSLPQATFVRSFCEIRHQNRVYGKETATRGDFQRNLQWPSERGIYKGQVETACGNVPVEMRPQNRAGRKRPGECGLQKVASGPLQEARDKSIRKEACR